MQAHFERLGRTGRLLLAGLLFAMIAFGIAETPPVARASNCQPGYCKYQPTGESGVGANGTAIQVQVPNVTAIGDSYDGVAFNAFIANNFNGNDAIEDGVVFGYSGSCGTSETYYYPYGTKDNGATERANCGIALTGGGLYWEYAYVENGYGTSLLTDVNHNDVWGYSWGQYSMNYGLNATSAEIHDFTDGSQPWWAGTVDMFHAQWPNGSGQWSYWGFTNTHNDCPYQATYYSPDAWQASALTC